MDRIIPLLAPDGQISGFPVKVVERKSGLTAYVEIDTEQDAALRALEEKHGGFLPITAEEYQALKDKAALSANVQ
jgi:hypothetical protein